MPAPVSSEGAPAPLVRFACSHCGMNLQARAAAPGKKGNGPACAKAMLVREKEAPAPPPARGKWSPILTASLLGAVLIGCAVWGKLTATQGGEYFNIARAMSRGQGYSHPFRHPVGP